MRLACAAIVCSLAVSLTAGASVLRAQQDNLATIESVGCLDGQPDSLRFENSTGVYQLTGNTAPLAPYIGKEVEVVGVPLRLWLATPGRAIEVVDGGEVANRPTVSLDPVTADPARWHTEIHHRLGVSIEFPGQRLPNLGAAPRSHLPIADGVVAVHRSAIPREIFPLSDFAGGYLAVFADPDLSGPEQCSAASPRSGSERRSAPNTLSIAGVDYSAQRDSEARSGSVQHTEYMRTYRNGICYEFAFLYQMADSENSGAMGCMLPDADPSQFARLVISEVSFFPPEVARK